MLSIGFHEVYVLLSGGRSGAGPTVSSSFSPFTASTSILSAIFAMLRNGYGCVSAERAFVALAVDV